MKRFVDDDDGYLAWIAQHPDGFVINTDRKPTPNYLRLHHATCKTISSQPANGRRWTTDYSKICGDRAELEAWAQRVVGGPVLPCPLCT